MRMAIHTHLQPPRNLFERLLTRSRGSRHAGIYFVIAGIRRPPGVGYAGVPSFMDFADNGPGRHNGSANSLRQPQRYVRRKSFAIRSSIRKAPRSRAPRDSSPGGT